VADTILCEDTRTTRKLLDRFGLKPPRLLSYHEHNKRSREPQILAAIKGGASVALVSDAGCPGISDPGSDLVKLAADQGLAITPIPGPCAAITALVAAGLNTDEFHFVGFLPKKRGPRTTSLRERRGLQGTLIFYVSPHNALTVVEDMCAVFGPSRQASLGRELTKVRFI